MTSWTWRLAFAFPFLSACGVDHVDAQKEARVRARALEIAPRPVRITDAEAKRKLAGVELSEPRLCDESCWDRDPALFTDLDAFVRTECTKDPDACPRVPSVGARAAQGQAREAGPAR